MDSSRKTRFRSSLVRVLQATTPGVSFNLLVAESRIDVVVNHLALGLDSKEPTYLRVLPRPAQFELIEDPLMTLIILPASAVNRTTLLASAATKVLRPTSMVAENGTL